MCNQNGDLRTTYQIVIIQNGWGKRLAIRGYCKSPFFISGRFVTWVAVFPFYPFTFFIMVQSIEPNIADLANGWLKSYGLDYKLEQESLNTEIDKALADYFSKNGWAGKNRPDAKLLLRDKNQKDWPILIEYKGYKDKLVKLDGNWQVENKKSKNERNFKNINNFAVNWAVHYANAILHFTNYSDIISIWMTWYKDWLWKIQYEIWVYYVSKTNLWVWQKVWEFTDFSFLAKNNFDEFIEKVKNLSLSEEELNRLKEQREKEIDASLVKLNNDIY